jgi:hypothetical protein
MFALHLKNYHLQVDFTGCTNAVTTVTYQTSFPSEIEDILYSQYDKYNGSTSTLNDQIQNLVYDVITSSNPYTPEDEQIPLFWFN